MKNREIARQIQKLDTLFSKAPAACGNDIESMAHWAKYLCVLTAGLIENALEELYGDYVDKTANPAVARYARSQLAKVQNPKTHTFLC